MNKYYFLWIPRTGGSTLWKAMEKSGEKVFRNSGYVPDYIYEDAKYATLQHVKIKKPADRKVITILRNPFDRVASVYQHLANGRPDQQEHVRGLCWSGFVAKVVAGDIPEVDNVNSQIGLGYANPAENWLMDGDYAIADGIFYTETLTHDWPAVCSFLDLPEDTPCRISNKERGESNYIYMYSPGERQAMRKRFQWEINNFYPYAGKED